MQHMLALRERKAEESKDDWAVCGVYLQLYLSLNKLQDILEEEGFDDDAALDKAIKKLETELRKARKTEADGEDLEGGEVRRYGYERLPS